MTGRVQGIDVVAGREAVRVEDTVVAAREGVPVASPERKPYKEVIAHRHLSKGMEYHNQVLPSVDAYGHADRPRFASNRQRGQR